MKKPPMSVDSIALQLETEGQRYLRAAATLRGLDIESPEPERNHETDTHDANIVPITKRHTLSADVRRRMSEAQKTRWAAQRKRSRAS